MLEMMRNPSVAFIDVIKKHFWLKRHEIVEQVESNLFKFTDLPDLTN